MRPIPSKTAIFCALAALSVLGGVWWMRSGIDAAPQAHEPASPVRNAAQQVAAPVEQPEPPRAGDAQQILRPLASASCRFDPGTSRAWDITSTLSVTVDPSAILGPTALAPGQALGPQRASPVTIGSTLVVEALSDASPDGSVLLARLGRVSGEAILRSGSLDAPFLLRIAPDCSIAGFARHAATPLLAARAQQAIVHQLFFRLPEKDTASFEGRDTTGAYQAIAVRSDQALQRRIVAYEKVWENTAPMPRVDRSLLTVRRDAGIWFSSMEGQETLRAGPAASTETELTVTPAAIMPGWLASAPRAESQYVWEDLLPRWLAPLPTSGFSSQDRREQEAVKHISVEEAVEQFTERVRTHPNINDQWKALATYFEARPDTIPHFEKKLRENALAPKLRAPAFLALGMARVPEARDALLHVKDDRRAATQSRMNAALVLVNRKDVDVALARSLRADAGPVLSRAALEPERNYARTAALALGMMGAVHGERMPEVAVEARGMIGGLLASASGPAELSIAFGAIGNLGDPSYLPDIARWSQHQSPLVREVAVKALRRLPLPTVHDLLLGWLGRERDPATRRELYRTLHGIVIDTKATLPRDLILQTIKDLEPQPGVITRQAMTRLLGPLAAESPEVKQALLHQLVLEVGNSTGMFNLIARYLPGADIATALEQMPKGESSGARP